MLGFGSAATRNSWICRICELECVSWWLLTNSRKIFVLRRLLLRLVETVIVIVSSSPKPKAFPFSVTSNYGQFM